MLTKEKLYYLVGLIGSKTPFFVLIPILSFYFNKSEIGKIDLILVTVTLSIPLISLQLGEASFRFLKEFLNSKSKIISTAIIGLFVSAMFFLVLIMFFWVLFDFKELILYSTVFMSSFIINNLLLIYRGLSRIKSYALLGVLSGFFSIILIILFIDESTTLLEVSFLFGIAHLISIIISLLESSVLRDFSFSRFNKKLIYLLLAYSLPLIPNSISWWLIDLGNRYVIKFTLGEEYLGVFAVAARYIVIVAFINSFFLLMWQDKYLGNRFKESDIKSDFDQFIKIQLSIVIFIISISYYLIKLGAGPEFIDSYKLVGPIALSLFFSSTSAYAGVEFLKAKKTKSLFFSTLKGGLVNVVLALILVNFFGLYGVVFSSMVGFLTTFYLRVKDSQNLKLMYKKIEKKLYLAISVMSLVYIIQLYESSIATLATIIIVFSGLLYWNKKIILNIL